MNKYLVFDMDGTIVDFYGVKDWKEYLDVKQDPTPYRIAKPMYNMYQLNAIIKAFRRIGYKVIVATWLSRVTDKPGFREEVIAAKRQWLRENKFYCDEIRFMDYGTDKMSVLSDLNGLKILIDDNDEVLKTWHGPTIDGKTNIIDALVRILGGHIEDK